MKEHVEKIRVLIENFDEETLRTLDSITTVLDLKKGELLLQQGEVCRKSYQLVSGVARKFFISEKKK